MALLAGGFSQLGSGVAQFAGNAAINEQRADLERQSQALADQLATAREHVGRVEAGQIAATAAEKQQAAEAALETQRQAGAMARTQTEQAGALQRTKLETEAEPPEVRFAKWYTDATPEQKAAYAQAALAKAGVPSWAPTSSSAAPPAPSAAPADGSKAPAAVQGQKSGFNEKALEGMPEGDAAIVRGMVAGKVIPPTSGALRDPRSIWNAYLKKAMEYDPNFDEATWSNRVKLQNDVADGKTADNRQALGQAINHLDEFDRAAHDLNNKGFTPLNKAQNYLGATFDDPRINEFNRTSQAFSTEMGKVYKGTGVLGEKELDEWKATNNINSGPRTLADTAPKTIAMFDGRIDSIQQKWHQTMGNQPMPPMLTPDAQEIYDRLSKGQGRFTSAKTGWPTSGPNSNDIAALNKDPTLAANFDKKYGDGTAKTYLGRWEQQQPAAAGAGGKEGPPPAPLVKSDREVGKSYALPNGKVGIWRGAGWEQLQQPPAGGR